MPRLKAAPLAARAPRREALRYLGCGPAAPSAATAALLEECFAELGQAATPTWLARRFALERGPEGLRCAGVALPGTTVAQNLAGCGQAYLFAATLGPGPDRLLLRYGRTAVARAAVLHAAGAALVEQLCDEACAALAADARAEGLFLRPRFSPGYGDLPLALQPQLVRVLDAPRQIGLTVTDHFVLRPGKSVTAVLGLCTQPGLCARGCASCTKQDCIYRRKMP